MFFFFRDENHRGPSLLPEHLRDLRPGVHQDLRTRPRTRDGSIDDKKSSGRRTKSFTDMDGDIFFYTDFRDFTGM